MDQMDRMDMDLNRGRGIPLYEDETVEDLQLDGLRMIQGRNLFRFGEDSVLLANFVSGSLKKSKEAKRTLTDLGCNCGSISLLLSAKLPNMAITGVEITGKASEIFERNIELNRIRDRVSCIHKDWNRLRETLPPGGMDYVVSNPPYTIPDPGIPPEPADGLKPMNGLKETAGERDRQTIKDARGRAVTDLRIAREEIYSSLDQLLQISSYLLKEGGKAFYIYRASRMVDVLEGMRKHRIEPKLLRIILPFAGKAPTAFLVMGQKGGKPGGFVEERPLVLFDRPSRYTEEAVAMYGKYPPLTREELYRDIEPISGKRPESGDL